MMDSRITNSPGATAARADSLFARAFDGVTPSALGFVGALVLAKSATKVVNHFVVALVDGHMSDWLLFAAGQVASYLVIATLMFSTIVATGNLGPQQGWQRIAALGSAIASAGLCAVAVRLAFIRLLFGDIEVELNYLALLRYEGSGYVFLAGMLTLVAEFYRRERANLAMAHQANTDRGNLARQMAQACVQVLQAQIEPHFLFNTLANVRRLYDIDREGGHRMLDNLMRYLEVALPRMRTDTSTLGREIELIESYLNVQQIRIGRRLAFSIEVAGELKPLGVPPMMLLTLVENALKHGISTLLEGGTVRVTAQIAVGQLVLSVIDDGCGLSSTSGVGTGLANVRARLRAVYGDAACLAIIGNEPRGIIARLSLPATVPAVPAAEAFA